MAEFKLIQPMGGCKVLTVDGNAILFGQPPEVLKSLLRKKIKHIDCLVLPDVRERDGYLLNNLEFPLYYFLFIAKALEQNRKLKLVGDSLHIDQVYEYLRLTLHGPSRDELIAWHTEASLREEWLNASEFFAIKDNEGAVRPVRDYFEEKFIDDDQIAEFDAYSIRRIANDQFLVIAKDGDSYPVNLNESSPVIPPYVINADYIPNNLVNFGLDVLGGASGFSAEQASTGLVICFNGNYILIDAVPFLDQHLAARGISKNQVKAIFLTHIHDDHCSLMPLMQTSQKLEIITTREIFEMSLAKLSLGIGWTIQAIREHFDLVEVQPGKMLNYYGLRIETHVTVHSIPTIGATFKTTFHGRESTICIVGDNQSFSEIREMTDRGLIRETTEDRLRALYSNRFDLLIADGGMGALHGDPGDAIQSESERVVFVHIDSLPPEFNATFSLASSGKRYVVMDGTADIFNIKIIEFLMSIFQCQFSTRWLGTLLADKVIKQYNTDDVIIKQGAETRGMVFLILTGYCEVMIHDGSSFKHRATREAGDLVGEMAIITGQTRRNASVVARTPVTVCEFSEETFDVFIREEHLKETLLENWSLRLNIGQLPQFCTLGSTIVDLICQISSTLELQEGEELNCELMNEKVWYIICSGNCRDLKTNELMGPGDEFGKFRPYTNQGPMLIRAEEKTSLSCLPRKSIEALLLQSPRFNYCMRKYRQDSETGPFDWSLTEPLDKDWLLTG